jgi:hypothetical protein
VRSWIDGGQLRSVLVLLLLLACRTAMEDSVQRDRGEILSAISARGEAAVVVALVEPSGFSDPARGVEVRAEIARMQSEVLAAVDSADFRPGQRFTSVPALAGRLRTERGLRLLLAHPHVRRVSLDAGGTGSPAP